MRGVIHWKRLGIFCSGEVFRLVSGGVVPGRAGGFNAGFVP